MDGSFTSRDSVKSNLLVDFLSYCAERDSAQLTSIFLFDKLQKYCVAPALTRPRFRFAQSASRPPSFESIPASNKTIRPRCFRIQDVCFVRREGLEPPEAIGQQIYSLSSLPLEYLRILNLSNLNWCF